MEVNFKEIDNALNFYQINDIDYRNKCYKCVEELNIKNDFNNKSEEIYNILYTNKPYKIETLWKKQNLVELFGDQYDSFITSVLVLLGYKLHDNNMKKKEL